MNTKEKYLGFKRFLALVGAIGLWGMSIYFSYNGFKFNSTTILWFGVVLALVVTVVELAFNTRVGKLNPTLLLSGILCYAYGIYTNIIGFFILQHGTADGFWSGNAWFIPVFAGLIAEILPEALFAWALIAGGEGDLLGNILEMISGTTQNQDEEKKFHRGPYEQSVDLFEIYKSSVRPESRFHHSD